MGRLFYDMDELLGQPSFPGVKDPRTVYYHFRPARPANLLVTRDPDSKELNLASGTFGPLTDRPYCLCLHLHSSPHSTRNLSGPGAECVVALPGRDLVRETWIAALALPRGVCEVEVAELTLLPSQAVDVPGIAECPVNLECVVEFSRNLYDRAVAIFLRVIAASVDEEMLARDRAAQIWEYPTYEVDDATNEWGGSIERLGLNGDLIECPSFPVGAKHGFNSTASEWFEDLNQEGFITELELQTFSGWVQDLGGSGARRQVLLRQITRALTLAAWEEWDDLHEYLSSGEERP